VRRGNRNFLLGGLALVAVMLLVAAVIPAWRAALFTPSPITSPTVPPTPVDPVAVATDAPTDTPEPAATPEPTDTPTPKPDHHAEREVVQSWWNKPALQLAIAQTAFEYGRNAIEGGDTVSGYSYLKEGVKAADLASGLRPDKCVNSTAWV
jgi:hypothetical protein